MESFRVPQLDERFDQIVSAFDGIESLDRNSLYGDLALLYIEWIQKSEWGTGCARSTWKAPSIMEKKRFLAKSIKQIGNSIAWIDNSFTYQASVTCPMTGEVTPCSVPAIPREMAALRKHLLLAQESAICTKLGLPEEEQRETAAEIEQWLRDRLQQIYESHSGMKATASTIGRNDHRSPSRFQAFCLGCFKAFGLKIKPSFFEKTSKKLKRSPRASKSK